MSPVENRIGSLITYPVEVLQHLMIHEWVREKQTQDCALSIDVFSWISNESWPVEAHRSTLKIIRVSRPSRIQVSLVTICLIIMLVFPPQYNKCSMKASNAISNPYFTPLLSRVQCKWRDSPWTVWPNSSITLFFLVRLLMTSRGCPMIQKKNLSDTLSLL